jgi:hypothetical protein
MASNAALHAKYTPLLTKLRAKKPTLVKNSRSLKELHNSASLVKKSSQSGTEFNNMLSTNSPVLALNWERDAIIDYIDDKKPRL